MTVSKTADLGEFSPLQKIAFVKGLLAFRAKVIRTQNRKDAELLGSWSDILGEALDDIGFADQHSEGQK